MSRRHSAEGLSPRALARLRASPRSYVPTERDLGGVRGETSELNPAAMQPDSGAEAHPSGRRSKAVAGDEGDAPPPAGGRHARVPHPPRWVRLPAAFIGARWQPGRAALIGVLLVVVAAAAVFGLRVVLAQSAGGGTVIAPGGGSRAGPTGVTAGAVPVGVNGAPGSASGGPTPPASVPPQGAAPAPTSSGSVVVVHVVGRVKHPGIRRLPVGSRVADAVAAAGGATGKADLSALNLARVLVDGEQVRVPAVGEPVVPGPAAGPVPGGGGGVGGGGGAGGTGGGAGRPGTPVSLNTADLAALDTLPGVGPVLAQRILDWRSAHGRFTSVDELGEVSGIGEKLLAQLTPLVTL